MTIKELSKEIQGYIKDGVCYLVVYKVNQSWEYKLLEAVTIDDNFDNDKSYIEANEIDKSSIVINGYHDNFGSCTLSNIEYRIKTNYIANKI